MLNHNKTDIAYVNPYPTVNVKGAIDPCRSFSDKIHVRAKIRALEGEFQTYLAQGMSPLLRRSACYIKNNSRYYIVGYGPLTFYILILV